MSPHSLAPPGARAFLISVAIAVAALGCTGEPPQPREPRTFGAAQGPPCSTPVTTGEPPAWARGGFSPGAEVAHVVGARGEIVALVFGHPLSAPPLPGRSNKIRWVARPDASPATTLGDEPLRIEARLGDGDVTVTREVPGGPGSSVVDLPTPGCWRLRLTWAGHSDSLDIPYGPA